MRMDANGDPQPLLAKSYTVSPDGKTYSFDLVKTNWEDGVPMTSDDVKYSLLEVSSKYSSVFAGAGRVIDTIDTPAPDKVIIHLKQPYGPFLISLACQQGGSVLPKHIYEGTNPLTNKATTEKPVGLGPFLLKERKRGDHLTLVKNPNYWEPGKPYLDEVIAKIIPQAGSRTQALIAGEVDFITNYFLPASDYNVVKSNPKLLLAKSSTPPSVDFMFLNVNRKPLDNKKVRQALFIAMDRDYIAKTAYLGVGGAGTTLRPPLPYPNFAFLLSDLRAPDP
jgi:peptide/nickel transport system substrate-binding protein